MQILKSVLSDKDTTAVINTLSNSLKTHQKKERSLLRQEKQALIHLEKLRADIVKVRDIISRADTARQIIIEQSKKQ
jgi:hypothetical protein